MRTANFPASERPTIVAVIVSLFVCGAVSGTTANTLAGVSAAAGDLTLMLSFYALIVFGLHLIQGLALARPAAVRRWNALILLGITAVSCWMVVLGPVNQTLKTAAAFAPACVLTGLIFGPWRGLRPASGRPPKDRVSK